AEIEVVGPVLDPTFLRHVIGVDRGPEAPGGAARHADLRFVEVVDVFLVRDLVARRLRTVLEDDAIRGRGRDRLRPLAEGGPGPSAGVDAAVRLWHADDLPLELLDRADGQRPDPAVGREPADGRDLGEAVVD